MTILEYLTGNDASDCEVLPKMQDELPKSVKKGYGDGAYDKDGCYRMFHELGIEPVIPPQKNAVLQDEKTRPWMQSRNDALRQITGLGEDEEARKLWKKLSGYHGRSIAETAMYRFKTLFGGSLACREEPYQKAELYAKCLAINRMNSLGMPKGKWVAV